MNKGKKITITGFIFFLAFIVVGVWLFAQGGGDSLLYRDILSKNTSELTLSEKTLLFRKYFKEKNIIETLKMFQLIERDADRLTPEQSLYVGANAGKIARADGDFEYEHSIYERFFKVKYPFYYHLFSAASYGAQNRKTQQRDELLAAKSYSVNEKQNEIIDKLLVLNQQDS